MKYFFSGIIFLIAIIYIFYSLDISLLFDSLFSFSFGAIAFLVVLNIISLYLIGFRFVILYNKISLNESFRINTISMGVNQVIPARGGDVLKLFMIKKLTKTKISSLLAVLLIERFLDIFVLVLIAFLIMPLSIGVILFFFITFIIFFMIFNKKYILKTVKILKKIQYKKLKHFILKFYIALVKIDKIILQKAFFITLFMYMFYLISMFLFIKFFTLFNLEFIKTSTVFLISTLGLLVPSIPASIGTFEASVVFALDMYNISKESALSFALVYHFIQIITILLFTSILLLKAKYE